MKLFGLFLIFGFTPLVYFTYRFLSYFIKKVQLRNYSRDLEIRKDLLSKIEKYNSDIPWSIKFTKSEIFNEFKKIVCQYDYYSYKKIEFYNKKLFNLYKDYIPEWKQKSRKEKLSNILD